MNDIAKLVPTKPDAEIAEELKQEIAEALKPVLEVTTKALSLGFHVNFNLGPNAFNKMVIQALVISKNY